MQGRNTQYIICVPSLPGGHGLFVTGLVALSKSLGNDKIECVANGIRFVEPKQTLGSWIPGPHCAAGVGDNDSIRGRFD